MSNEDFGSDVLHCYAQPSWHQDAFISGGKVALLKLRAAIDAALSDGTGSFYTFAADGEGYTIHVVAMKPEDALRQDAPYTSDYAAAQRASFGPWSVL